MTKTTKIVKIDSLEIEQSLLFNRLMITGTDESDKKIKITIPLWALPQIQDIE